jgi:HEPN domain-containing protein
MGNATAAKEWLSFAHKDLEELLAEVDSVLKFDDYVETMTRLNGFYIASRYPMPILFSPSKEQTKTYIVKTLELYETIKNICA